MPANDNRTEAEKLRQKSDTLRARFGLYIKEAETNRRYYERNFKSDVIPPRWQSRMEAIIPQTARRAIDEPADHILAFPHIKVPVRPTEKDEAEEQVIAEVKRHALNAWWTTVSRRYNVIGDGKKPFLNEGKIAIRKTIDWNLLPDFPAREDYKTKRGYNNAVSRYRSEIETLGKAEFLWNVELLDNITVLEDPSNHRDPRYVFIKYRIYVEDARENWPDATGDWTDKDDLDEVEYMEYWSKPESTVDSKGDWEPGKFMQWVNDEVVHEAANPYPYVPVVIEDTGFGVTHALAKPHERFVGLTQHAREMFRAQAESMSAWHAINRLAAFPIGKGRNLGNKEIAIGPGEIIDFDGTEGEPGAEDLSWLQHPEVPRGVMEIATRIDQEANATFKTDTLSGIPMRGVDTATEADLNVRNAVAKLSGPIAALERLIVRLTRQVLMDVELVLRAPVTLYGTSGASTTPAEIRLRPSDINGFYEVHAELRTSEQDAIQQSKARFWLEAARVSPSLSHTTAMEKGEIADDPFAEMIRRAGEDIFLGERFRAARELAAAQALGMELERVEDAESDGQPASDEGILGPAADARVGDIPGQAMTQRDAQFPGQAFLGG